MSAFGGKADIKCYGFLLIRVVDVLVARNYPETAVPGFFEGLIGNLRVILVD